MTKGWIILKRNKATSQGNYGPLDAPKRNRTPERPVFLLLINAAETVATADR